MKKPFTYSKIILLAFLCYSISSCSVAKKKKEKRLIGSWEIINVIESNPKTTRQWIFSDNGDLTIQEKTDSTTIVLEIGTWALDQKVSTAFINTVFGSVTADQEGLNVNWEILYLNKQTMYINYQDGGLITREFERTE